VLAVVGLLILLKTRSPWARTMLLALALTTAVVACQSPGDPYFPKVVDQEAAVGDGVERLNAALNANLYACQRSTFSTAACDRVVGKFDEFRSAIAQVRRSVAQLEPPVEASGWHEDYLAYLLGVEAWANNVATAHQAGDWNEFVAEVDKFNDEIKADDHRLGSRFEQIQKDMGAP
jgi:hypothetical protein